MLARIIVIIVILILLGMGAENFWYLVLIWAIIAWLYIAPEVTITIGIIILIIYIINNNKAEEEKKLKEKEDNDRKIIAEERQKKIDIENKKKRQEMAIREEKERQERLKLAEKEKEKKQLLNELKIKINQTWEKLLSEQKKRANSKSIKKIKKIDTEEDICIDEIEEIVTPDKPVWSKIEQDIINYDPKSDKKFPIFTHDLVTKDVEELNKEIEIFNWLLIDDIKEFKKNKFIHSEMFEWYKNCQKETVISRFNFVINNIKFPSWVPKIWEMDYNPEQKIGILEIKVPDVVHLPAYKFVEQKNWLVKKPLNKNEVKEKIPTIQPAIILRVAYEIFRNDIEWVLELLVLNWWVEFDNPATWVRTKTYTISFSVNREQIMALNLEKLDPVLAFSTLKWKSAGKLIDIIPVSPLMSLDKTDKRFVETKDVLNKLDNESNLAAMDWQDFENLIAELFQREFSEEGVEIKLTQSSRDKWVDAIVFNPDPIRGGKYVIQAKRYTNTVDVSAVRDLVAVVSHEWASRGILVTTSTFWADAYAFVQGKPITLLDGAKLLGLLEKHNYKFRIDLSEAKKLNNLDD